MTENRELIIDQQQLSVINYAPVSLAMLDLALNYLSCSQTWLDQNRLGYPELDVCRQTQSNQNMPLDLGALYRSAIKNDCMVDEEVCWELNDGSTHWIRCTAKPWKTAEGSTGGLIMTREDVTQLHYAVADLNSVLGESGDATWISDAHGQFIYLNPIATRLTGYSAEELGKLNIANLIDEEYEDELEQYLALSRHAHFSRREWVLKHKSGLKIQVELTTGHLPGERIIFMARDLTEKLKNESERFNLYQAVEQSPGYIVITSAKAEIEYVNAAFLKKTGYTRQEVLGNNPRMIKSGRTPPAIYLDLWRTIESGQDWQGEISNLSKSGEEFVQMMRISPIRASDGKVCNYIAIGEDITEHKKDEARIYELAYFDQLTGLPNRTLLLDRLNQVIAGSERSGIYGALLFIDLDHFKNINDTLGHQKGDLILQQVAQSLKQRMREGDTVARFGGDEFVVLLTGLGTEDALAASNAKTAALKILDSLNQTFRLGETVHHNTASIGVALFNGHCSSTTELLKQADLAMYKSKKAGRNTIRFFDPSMESSMKLQATLIEDLRTAIRDQQFVLHYQGQFTGDSRLTGAEVLVRWQHPLKGMLSPALFIPFAEESGQILAIGHWVLEKACEQLALWAKDARYEHLTLAVNVSALQFRQMDFIDTVLSTIDRSRANPRRLKLELTESMLIENVDDIIHKMLTLKLIGIGFSLDDFGTGYSSLSFLKRLPLDQLKIDQSFIRDVHSDPNGAAIAGTIVALGKSLGMHVIAEGVETNEEREFLHSAGCHSFQGYLFSRPLALREFETMAATLASTRHPSQH